MPSIEISAVLSMPFWKQKKKESYKCFFDLETSANIFSDDYLKFLHQSTGSSPSKRDRGPPHRPCANNCHRGG